MEKEAVEYQYAAGDCNHAHGLPSAEEKGKQWYRDKAEGKACKPLDETREDENTCQKDDRF